MQSKKFIVILRKNMESFLAIIHVSNHSLTSFDMNSQNIMNEYLNYLTSDISDYTFSANFIWLSNSTGFYSIINNTFCLFYLSGGELSMPLPPIGKKEYIYNAILQCFCIMNENNSSKYYSKIEYVDESMLEFFVESLEEGTVIFDFLEDYLIEKKLVDYVYESDKLIHLTGKSFHSKRNEINKFNLAYKDFKIERLSTDKHAKQIIDLFNKWVNDRLKYMPKEETDVFLDGIYLEKHAIQRMLKYYNELNLIGIVIYIDGTLKGFTVGEKINDNISSVIIEKTDFEILGCAQFIFREFSKLLKEYYGTHFINIGDDMGFENLKKVKMSYRPDKLIPKYTIYQK